MRWKQPEETNPPIDARDPELERLLQSMPLARVPDRLDQRVRLALAAGRPAGWFAVGALSATAAAADNGISEVVMNSAPSRSSIAE